MNWTEDIDSQARKRSAPKKGRRATNRTPDLTESILDSVLESVGSPPLSPQTKIGAWAEEVPKSAKNKNIPNIIEQERFQLKAKELEDDDILVIPDMDDFQDEETVSSVEVKAPLTLISESTYKELDSELKREIPGTLLSATSDVKFGDINFASLTRKMWPEKDIVDEDEALTFEMLQEEFSSLPVRLDVH